ncbi:MAG: endonuclease/exonuclease/phosphatase family protein [Chthoniobacteraceae bacterium]
MREEGQYYAAPWGIILAIALLLAWVWRGRKHDRLFWISLILALTLSWAQDDWHFWPKTNQPRDLRVVLWNVASPTRRMPAQVKILRGLDPDIIALAETLEKRNPSVQRWREAFPEYQAVAGRGAMLLLVRGKAVPEERVRLSPGSYAQIVTATVRGRTLRVVQVDLAASVGFDRSLPFPRLQQILARHAAEDAILLGDFNTPSDSVHFQNLRRHWTNTFDAAGYGYRATWPLPLPVLDLDQIWTHGRVRVIRCAPRFTALSDHRLLRVDLAWDVEESQPHLKGW